MELTPKFFSDFRINENFTEGDKMKKISREKFEQNVPDKMKELNQWVVWKSKSRGNGKRAKIPFDPKTGFYADVTKPSTWTSFEKAVEAFRHGNYDGIGFVFTEEDNLIGVDLDDCFYENGQIDQAIRSKLNQLLSYTEKSPSGKGLHVIILTDKNSLNINQNELEIYASRRFFTVTGDLVDASFMAELRYIPEEKLKKIFKIEEPRGAAMKQVTLTQSQSEEIFDKSKPEGLYKKLEKILEAEGNKFKKLFKDGDIKDYYSQSEADMALVNLIAKYVQNEKEIDQIFRLSALYRDKWDKNSGQGKTYGERTIEKAQMNVSSHSLLNTDFTDSELAELLIKENPDIKYLQERKQWIIFNGSKWEVDFSMQVRKRVVELSQKIIQQAKDSNLKEEIKEAIINQAKKLQNLSKIQNILKLAESFAPVSIVEFDTNPEELNTPTGILNLMTGEIRKSTTKDKNLKITNVGYNPKTDTSEWEKFIEEVVPDPEIRNFLQKVAGYSLTGRTDEEKFFFIRGPSGTGKTTFLEVIAQMLGDYSTKTNFDVFLRKGRDTGTEQAIAVLQGARMVYGAETDEYRRFSEGILNEVVGGETIQGCYKFGIHFNFKPQFKLFLAANNRPRITAEEKDGIWRRLVEIPFENQPDKIDETLKTRLMTQENLEAVLKWAVDGAVKYYEEGLELPVKLKQLIAHYQQENDDLQEFLDEAAILGPGLSTKATELFKAYQNWIKETGQRFSYNRSEFKDKLLKKGYRQVKKEKGLYWEGINLNEEYKTKNKTASFNM